MEDRERRVGRNEALFREVNERLRAIGEGFSLVAEQAEFVCECAEPTCVERIAMSLDEYERVRVDPVRFFVKSGHEIVDVETVVDRRAGYVIVRKRDEAAEVARETDPRSRPQEDEAR